MAVRLLSERLKTLEATDTRLGDVVEAIAGFIFNVSPDRRLSHMNKALSEYLGSRATAQVCHQSMFGLEVPCDWCPLERVFQGETVKQEIRNPHDKRWYYLIQSPVYDERGAVSKAQVLMIDITERKQAEESLRETEKHLRQENVLLRSSLHERYRFGSIIGKSQAMQRVYELIVNAAATDANVIVTGESGTGKELVARAIHETSGRKAGSFVPVNCGAIPETLMESEFFGHRKGAFTGAVIDKHGFLDLADGGTLFLDELGEIGQSMQVKLLRAIDGGGFTPIGGSQVKTPDLRIIAATNRNLAAQVEKGVLREDFYYRIHVIPIHLPPLRERKEDIPLLVDHFVKKFAKGPDFLPVTARILDALTAHDWPGNVRELQNTISRYLTLKKLDFAGANLRQGGGCRDDISPETESATGNLDGMVEAYEKRLILKRLESNRWRREATAGALGIHRKTLFTKMKKYGLI